VQRLQFLTQLAQHPSAPNIAALIAIGVVTLAFCYLLSHLNPTVLVVTAIALQLFSGNWDLMGISIPLYRGPPRCHRPCTSLS
jgi:hypothetical protein